MGINKKDTTIKCIDNILLFSYEKQKRLFLDFLTKEMKTAYFGNETWQYLVEQHRTNLDHFQNHF